MDPEAKKSVYPKMVAQFPTDKRTLIALTEAIKTDLVLEELHKRKVEVISHGMPTIKMYDNKFVYEQSKITQQLINKIDDEIAHRVSQIYQHYLK